MSGTSGRIGSPGGCSRNRHSVPTSPRPLAHEASSVPSSRCKSACDLITLFARKTSRNLGTRGCMIGRGRLNMRSHARQAMMSAVVVLLGLALGAGVALAVQQSASETQNGERSRGWEIGAEVDSVRSWSGIQAHGGEHCRHAPETGGPPTSGRRIIAQLLVPPNRP